LIYINYEKLKSNNQADAEGGSSKTMSLSSTQVNMTSTIS